MSENVQFASLNRGEVSQLALARVDVEKLRVAGEIQENLIPRKIGPATLRPGTAYLGTSNNNAKAKYFGAFFARNDTAELEFTDSIARIWINDAPVTRSQVQTVIPAFTAWSLTPATDGFVGAGPPLVFRDTPAGTLSTADATVSVNPSDINTEHGVRFTVSRGPVTVKIGTTLGGMDLFQPTILDDGVHSLAFTPGATTFYIHLQSSDVATRTIDSVAIEAGGVLTLPTPWDIDDLPYIRMDQSADVLFFSMANPIDKASQQPRRVQRYGARAWAIVRFKSTDGPFPATEGDPNILITPSSLNGDTTLTSNLAVFQATHVNSLFRLFHSGQNSYRKLAASDTYSDTIEVTGVSKSTNAAGTTTATVDRSFIYAVTGTYVGVITIQRSFLSATAGFTDFITLGSAAVTLGTTVADNLDNVLVWYRIGFKAGNYTSGSAIVQLVYAGGGGAGVARITSYVSPTQVTAEILIPFQNITAASDWRASWWSDYLGWPGAVALHEGRLYFAGNNRLWGSIPDQFTNFSLDSPSGDSAVIDRSIGSGPIANIYWLISLTRLLAGADDAVFSARSTSFDEILTPTTINLKASVTLGCAGVAALKVDLKGIFVDGSQRRLYSLTYGGAGGAGIIYSLVDYAAEDLTRLNEDIGVPQFIASAIQRQPDTRIHLVRGDGQVAVLTYDVNDDVVAWWRWSFPGGFVEDVLVQPGIVGTLEDRVYYSVRRVINGQTVRTWERAARFDECLGGTISKNIDCHAIYQGSPTTTLTGLGYLEGQNVVVWADGKDVALDAGTDVAVTGGVTPYTVTGGQITLPVAVSNAVVGLYFNGTFKSAKLAYAAKNGTAINIPKKLDHLGCVLLNTHAKGFYHSPDGVVWDGMPDIDNGAATPVDYIWPMYDENQLEFGGFWDTDSRIWLRAHAPRPCTVMGLTFSISTSG